jgi:hypothetical protein
MKDYTLIPIFMDKYIGTIKEYYSSENFSFYVGERLLKRIEKAFTKVFKVSRNIESKLTEYRLILTLCWLCRPKKRKKLDDVLKFYRKKVYREYGYRFPSYFEDQMIKIIRSIR